MEEEIKKVLLGETGDYTLVREDAQEIIKDFAENEAILFCKNCGSVFKLSESKVAITLFLMGENFQTNHDWRAEYFESSFCQNCKDKTRVITIKKI